MLKLYAMQISWNYYYWFAAFLVKLGSRSDFWLQRFWIFWILEKFYGNSSVSELRSFFEFWYLVAIVSFSTDLSSAPKGETSAESSIWSRTPGFRLLPSPPSRSKVARSRKESSRTSGHVDFWKIGLSVLGCSCCSPNAYMISLRNYRFWFWQF